MLWCRRRGASYESGDIYAPGLAAFGLDPSLMMLGFGTLIGPRAGWSLLAGAVLAWVGGGAAYLVMFDPKFGPDWLAISLAAGQIIEFELPTADKADVAIGGKVILRHPCILH